MSDRIRIMARCILAAGLLAGLGLAFAAHEVQWNVEGFDAYAEDEGYIDLERDGHVLIVTLLETEGSIPATIEGDLLPLDDDVDEDRLRHPNALELYGGLPIDVGPTYVTLDLEGDPDAIDQAVLARLDALGLQVEELQRSGPVRAWRLSDGDAIWRLSLSHVGGGTMFHLQSVH